jgi:hypothetical protein
METWKFCYKTGNINEGLNDPLCEITVVEMYMSSVDKIGANVDDF